MRQGINPGIEGIAVFLPLIICKGEVELIVLADIHIIVDAAQTDDKEFLSLFRFQLSWKNSQPFCFQKGEIDFLGDFLRLRRFLFRKKPGYEEKSQGCRTG